MCSVHGRRSLGFGEGFPGKMSGKKYRESQPGEECMKGTRQKEQSSKAYRCGAAWEGQEAVDSTWAFRRQRVVG